MTLDPLCNDDPILECLQHVKSIAIAHLAIDGTLLATNAGFSYLVGKTESTDKPFNAAPFFLQPKFTDLVAMPPDENGILYKGMFTIGPQDGVSRTVQGYLSQKQSGLQLYFFAEHDVHQLDTMQHSILELNTALTEWQRKMARSNQELEQRVRERTSHLLKQQQETSLILVAMTEGIITIDEKGSILTLNPAAEKMFGYQSAEITGQNIKLLMPDSYGLHHDFYLQNYLTTGHAKMIGIGRQVEGRDKNGRIFPMRLAIAELNPDAMGTRRFIGTCHDLTYEKEQEEKLRQSQKMDALGKLTGGIAHDFNNMLVVILGYSELLQIMTKDDPKLSLYVQEIHHAGERAKNLTTRLLAFSRKRSSDAEPITINQILLNERQMLDKTLTAKIELQMQLAADLWPAYLDKFSFEDAILNMSINASHAMPAGGTLTITTQNITMSQTKAQTLNLPMGDYVSLCLRDTGSGMDAQTIQKIFDPFFSTKGDQGTGLGLSQVYNFVQTSQGSITVESELCHGTTFWLYFPRYQDTSTNNATKSDLPLAPQLQGHESILVVDDEPSILHLANEILIAQGYQVKTATSGEAALTLLENEPVDLLLSDALMPNMNGFTLATIVRARYPHIKIQIMSGYTDEAIITDSTRDLYEQRILKPYTANTLLSRIRQLLDSQPQ